MSSLRRRIRTSDRLVFVLGIHLRIHLEPDRIEQFQQAGEGNGLAVVRRGRGEKPMLEQEADFPQHSGTLACTPAALRGEVMALVHDQQVPRGVGHRAAIGFGIGADAGCLKELLQHVGHSQVIHRRDDSWKCLPRVRVDAHATAKLEGGVGVDDLEIQVELPPHFVLPLPLEHGRADDEDSADSSSQQEFLRDQPALDRLAQAHAIAQQ